jgi:hypothetical protein
MQNEGYRQPADGDRYPCAPGPLRICYASVAFQGHEVLIAYDISNNEATDHGTKLRVLSVAWFYET